MTDDDDTTGTAVQFIVVQPGPGGVFGNFTEVTPLDSVFVTPQDEDFWVITTAPADYDNDSDLDLLLPSAWNDTAFFYHTTLLRNDGASGTGGWNFTETDSVFAPTSHAQSAWADFDGDLDYFIAGQYFVPGGNGLVEAQMHIYRNDSPGQNFAPMSATQLNEVQIGNNTVMISWDPGSDDHTPVVALTYDLELFRDNVPVTLPNRTPEPGNVSAVNQWLITGLELGTYQYNLRTVDAAYIGSPVTTGEFTIGIVSADENPSGPATNDISLKNYPNPFNLSTMISFSVPEDGLVTLKVYNLAGDEVETLVDETKKAGNYKALFDAKDLPSGIYFYKIQAGGFSKTNKMIVTK